MNLPDTITGQLQLTFSYVGFSTEQVVVETGNDYQIDVQLQGSIMLGEVVILDYATPMMMMGAMAAGITVVDHDINEDSENSPKKAVILDEPELDVFPNPFHQSLRAEFKYLQRGNYSLLLFDASGKEIWSGTRKLDKGDSTIILNFPEELIDGTYILHVKSKFGQLNAVVVRQGE